ncbi:hypothetical protein BKA83DRAFT_4082356, partial [Pisolithus microcarpus]
DHFGLIALIDIHANHAGVPPPRVINYSLSTHADPSPLARLFVLRALPGLVYHFRTSFLFRFLYFFVPLSCFFRLGISFGRRRPVGRTG